MKWLRDVATTVFVIALGSLPAVITIGVWGYFRTDSNPRLVTAALVAALLLQFWVVYRRVKEFGKSSVIDASLGSALVVVVILEVVGALGELIRRRPTE